MFEDLKLNCENDCNKYDLFADDDSYQEFRQSIINAPIFPFDKKKLPFEDIKLGKSTLDFDVKLEFQFLMHSLMPRTSYPNRHLFYLYKGGICRAYGYFVSSTNYFVICEGSLVSSSVDSRYEETTSGKARVRFIREACEAFPNYYRVKKDAKCISATAAASYVLGRTARYTDWKDENGELLSKIFPKHFINKTTTIHLNSTINNQTSIEASKKSEEVSNIHRFYLKITSDSELRCYAIGEYDPISKQFILKEKSILSYNSQSKGDINRQLILGLYADKSNSKNTCTLKRDLPCASIKDATALVLGNNVSDGQNLWRDIDNKSFKDLFS